MFVLYRGLFIILGHKSYLDSRLVTHNLQDDIWMLSSSLHQAQISVQARGPLRSITSLRSMSVHIS